MSGKTPDGVRQPSTGKTPDGVRQPSSGARFSVTELAIAARCPRQMLFAREGYRIVEGDGGIGQTAHAVLAGFVTRGAEHPMVEEALARKPLDEPMLLTAVIEARTRCSRAGVGAAWANRVRPVVPPGRAAPARTSLGSQWRRGVRAHLRGK